MSQNQFVSCFSFFTNFLSHFVVSFGSRYSNKFIVNSETFNEQSIAACTDDVNVCDTFRFISTLFILFDSLKLFFPLHSIWALNDHWFYFYVTGIYIGIEVVKWKKASHIACFLDRRWEHLNQVKFIVICFDCYECNIFDLYHFASTFVEQYHLPVIWIVVVTTY